MIAACLIANPAMAQHEHHKNTDQANKSKMTAMILSPIMMLLDDMESSPEVNQPGIDVCSVMAEIDQGVYNFGQTPSPVDDDEGKVAEHNAIFEFVDYDRATHVAIKNGRWSDPSTWYNNRVPGGCANAVIPQSIAVTYDRELDERLNTVRVDGTLLFSNTASSKMVVDTLVVDPRGTLQIGTKSAPIRADVTVEILIADNGDINVSRDPMLLSRGIVAHGKTRIHGAKKRTHIKVAQSPMKNMDTITLAERPSGWQVGDTIIVAGTRYLGWKWNPKVSAVTYFGTQDEVRTITAIMGNTLRLDQALEYDHAAPRSDLKTSVANYSRNIVIGTENASQVATHQRGHVMFMHSNNVDVRYAEFHQLGRTDKSVPSFEVRDVANIQPNSNVRGRYSLHLHRIGTEDARSPAVIVGNAVFGSPGWGYTHHDSHAIFDANASFDTFGAGFVAETGNETGIWSNNIAIKAEGNRAINPKNGNEREEFDMGRNGVGFWFQGRMVTSLDNLAASVNNGFAYLHRGTGMINFPAERFMLPEALGFNSRTTPDDAPIRNFDGNEAQACTLGLYVVKANPDQGHDIYTVISDFLAWNVRFGVGLEYTAHYLVDGIDVIGAEPEPFFKAGWGLDIGTNTSDMVIKDARIQAFDLGMSLSKHYTNPNDIGNDQYVIIDPIFIDVDDHYDLEDSTDQFISKGDLVNGRFEIDINKINGRFEFLSGRGDAGAPYVGKKVDSIGEIRLPAGTESNGIFARAMIGNLKTNGYFTEASSGDVYTIVENYYSDRATGEIQKFGFKTYLGGEIVRQISRPGARYYGAKSQGTINLNSQPPVASDDRASTRVEQDVRINLISNDSDPEGDRLSIDGIVQPRNGMVFLDNNNTVTYRPLPNHTGNDSFEYWATDNQGNFSKASVTVTTN